MTKQMKRFIIVMSTILTVISLLVFGVLTNPVMTAGIVLGGCSLVMVGLICFAIYQLCGD